MTELHPSEAQTPQIDSRESGIQAGWSGETPL